MFKKLFILLIAFCSEASMQEDFVFLTDIAPNIVENSRYFSEDNFVGRKIDGYNSPKIICTKQAAHALKKVSILLEKDGYKLVVYDGYRPKRASRDFVEWAKNLQDIKNKAYYYPHLNKQDLFKLGYIAENSTHSRGSTFDVTIIPINKNIHNIIISEKILTSGEKIPFLDDGTEDMGSSFDLFHKVSHHNTSLIADKQKANRELLKKAMVTNGFKEYSEEWWHYTLENEPFPDNNFDFEIKD